MTYDVMIGKTPILVTTSEEAAREIADAIEANSKNLFQCDGMRVTVMPSDRDSAAPRSRDEELWAAPYADIVDEIRTTDDLARVAEILEIEGGNPRSAGPRISVMNAAAARLADEE